VSKKPTVAEIAHMSLVAEIPCLICARPAEIHHCGTHMGGGRDHMKVIPLCPPHHRTGGYGVAFHAGKNRWQEHFGYESEHLETVRLLLNN